jgi:uncharacterized protein YndB with AHSA1/START domain
MVVNVCPAGIAKASPDRVWSIVSNPSRFPEWLDVTLAAGAPSGPPTPGQVFKFETRELGRSWPVDIEVKGLDPNRRWIDLRVNLPLGVVNDEHVTLTPADDGGTLVRFN